MICVTNFIHPYHPFFQLTYDTPHFDAFNTVLLAFDGPGPTAYLAIVQAWFPPTPLPPFHLI